MVRGKPRSFKNNWQSRRSRRYSNKISAILSSYHRTAQKTTSGRTQRIQYQLHREPAGGGVQDMANQRGISLSTVVRGWSLRSSEQQHPETRSSAQMFEFVHHATWKHDSQRNVKGLTGSTSLHAVRCHESALCRGSEFRGL